MNKYIVQMGYSGLFLRRVRIENVSAYDISGELVSDYAESLFGDPPLAFDEETLKKSETYKLQHIGDPNVGCYLRITVTDPLHLDETARPFQLGGKTLAEIGNEISEQEKIDFFAPEVYSTPCLDNGLSWKEAISKVPYHFVYDGELFLENDHSGDVGYLTLEGHEKDWNEAEIETEGDFDPAKLEIHYRSYKCGDGTTNFVSKWMSYDGRPLKVHQSRIYNSHGDAEHYVELAWIDSASGRTVYKDERVEDDEGFAEYRWKREGHDKINRKVTSKGSRSKKYVCMAGDEVVDGSPVGSKRTVLKWMREQYGELEPGFMDAMAFFAEKFRENYETEDGEIVTLAEV